MELTRSQPMPEHSSPQPDPAADLARVGLLPLAADLWECRQPLKLGMVELDHRMIVARLPSGELWVHSPVALTDPLQQALATLGPVSHLVAPSRFHDLYWPAWFAAYPKARFYAAPGVDADHRDLPFTDDLQAATPSAWGDVLASKIMRGVPSLNETVFLHRPSGNLILADLMFNYTPEESRASWGRSLTLRMAGTHSRAGVSRFVRFLIRDRAALRDDLDQILRWDFDRIAVGHGSLVESEGPDVLSAAWSFLRR